MCFLSFCYKNSKMSKIAEKSQVAKAKFLSQSRAINRKARDKSQGLVTLSTPDPERKKGREVPCTLAEFTPSVILVCHLVSWGSILLFYSYGG